MDWITVAEFVNGSSRPRVLVFACVYKLVDSEWRLTCMNKFRGIITSKVMACIPQRCDFDEMVC
jgi:hypothetical protein